MTASVSPKWHPLELFESRFRENLAALATRDPGLAGRLDGLKPASPMFIAAEGDTVYLGRSGPAGIEVIPNAIPPAAARNFVQALYPGGTVHVPVVIGGLAYGWVWDSVSKLPCRMEGVPGHRPPIYLLASDIERLWAVLHVLDWRDLLSQKRLPIFVGPDATDQLREFLIGNPTWPAPKLCLRVEPQLWRDEFSSFSRAVLDATEERLRETAARLRALYPAEGDSTLAEKFRNGRLRVLGITSRYTSFLQHSMRDWLAGFERLGHHTRLLIEPDDHLMLGPTGFAQGVLEYRPDLIVIIDHYRSEVGNIPQSVPCVMWVQDRLAGIFSARAGAAQGPRDFCVGFGRLHLARRFGYPAERFLSSTIGINEEKFVPRRPTADESARFGCDVSYVSHASTPSDVLVRDYLAAHSVRPDVGRLIRDVHDRMVAHFEAGGRVLSDDVLRRQLSDATVLAGIGMGAAGIDELVVFFGQKVNNAIFRHQALRWVADAGVDLRLYGAGWEKHPTLGRFARGEADNRVDLPKIYLASRINLQVIPHGAVHQRMLDGLAGGGFFLMRRTPGDALGIPYQRLWDWCRRHDIRSDAQMRQGADEHARRWIAEIDALQGYDTSTASLALYDCLETLADQSFATLAGACWPEIYPCVSFESATELRDMLARYLGDADLRQRTADEMRRVIIDRCSYRSINRRLIDLIEKTLRSEPTSEQISRGRAA